MAKSPAFARMKKALLAETQAIPPGHVVEVGVMAAALNIPPRHVAYILSQLDDDEADLAPWHRVVPKGGKFPSVSKRSDRHVEQIDRLIAEGAPFPSDGRVDVKTAAHEPSMEHASTIWADEVN